MGLAERRAVEAIKTGEYKKFVSDVKSTVGKDVKVDVDWASIENHSDCISLVEGKKPQTMFFDYTLTALKAVAKDSMGKTALKEKLKSISFVNKEGDLTFADGELVVNNSLDGNGVYDADRIQETLEGGL